VDNGAKPMVDFTTGFSAQINLVGSPPGNIPDKARTGAGQLSRKSAGGSACGCPGSTVINSRRPILRLGPGLGKGNHDSST